MKSRNISLDYVRIFATVGVIAIHTEVITSSPTNYLGGISWWFANIIHSLAVVSVPLFVMLTGALILQKPRNTWNYVVFKVFHKFFISLAFWWSVYTVWQIYTHRLHFDILPILRDFWASKVGHLYYLQIVIWLYLLSPVVLFVWNKMSNRFKHIFIGLVSLLSVVYTYSCYLLLKTYGSTNIFVIALPVLPYMLWGKLLANRILNNKQLVIAFGVLLFVLGFTSIATYINILAFNQNMKLFWTPLSGNLFFEPFTINVFLMTLLSFLILKTIGEKPYFNNSKLLRNCIFAISQITFGIYLIHPLILELVDRFFRLSIQFITYPLWIYYLFKIFLVTLISSAVVVFITYVPLLKKTIGY